MITFDIDDNEAVCPGRVQEVCFDGLTELLRTVLRCHRARDSSFNVLVYSAVKVLRMSCA